MEQGPVCGMIIKIKDENLAVEFNKNTYYKPKGMLVQLN